MGDLDGLTNAARALLAAQWMNPKSTLRYAMIGHEPSSEAAECLGELVEAGILSETREANGGLLYSLTDSGREIDRRPPGDTPQARFRFMAQHGRFSLSRPLAARDEETG